MIYFTLPQLVSSYYTGSSEKWGLVIAALLLERRTLAPKWFNIDKIVQNLLKLATSHSCSTSCNFSF